MSETVNDSLYRQTVDLLAPGEVELEGAVVHTSYGSDDESMLHQATLDAGTVVAEHAGKGDTYVYSGNDDSNFGVNQHQGLTLDGDEFVWECQQLLRDGTFDVVLYWEVAGAHDDVLAGIEAVDGVERVVGVTEDGYTA